MEWKAYGKVIQLSCREMLSARAFNYQLSRHARSSSVATKCSPIRYFLPLSCRVYWLALWRAFSWLRSTLPRRECSINQLAATEKVCYTGMFSTATSKWRKLKAFGTDSIKASVQTISECVRNISSTWPSGNNSRSGIRISKAGDLCKPTQKRIDCELNLFRFFVIPQQTSSKLYSFSKCVFIIKGWSLLLPFFSPFASLACLLFKGRKKKK